MGACVIILHLYSHQGNPPSLTVSKCSSHSVGISSATNLGVIRNKQSHQRDVPYGTSPCLQQKCFLILIDQQIRGIWTENDHEVLPHRKITHLSQTVYFKDIFQKNFSKTYPNTKIIFKYKLIYNATMNTAPLVASHLPSNTSCAQPVSIWDPMHHWL